MSRIGKKPIEIPAGVTVQIEGKDVNIKGPKAALSRHLHDEIEAKMEGNLLSITPAKQNRKTNALWGLERSLVFNMVKGVTSGYEKKLELEGVGYKAEVTGNKINLSLGFSHPVIFEIPADLKIVVEKGLITVSGADKASVGQFAAKIRKVRPVEPYKGKGVRYAGEVVRRKLGKRAATAGAAGAK